MDSVYRGRSLVGYIDCSPLFPVSTEMLETRPPWTKDLDKKKSHLPAPFQIAQVLCVKPSQY